MISKFEEMKLLALCMATDNREAFSRLVVTFQDGLRRFLFNLTDGDAALTDDLSQETFIKAWLAIRSFHGMSGFKTWLYRIAVNEFVSYRRKKSAAYSLPLDAAPPDSHLSCHEHDSTEAQIDVKVLLDALPEKERIVALLFYLEDMPIKQISKVTSMPEGTVKSHLNRARTHMSNIR